MGLFLEAGSNFEDHMEETCNTDELMEAFIIDEISHLPDSLIQEFCEPGGVGDQLVMEGKLRSKNTIVRMAKKDDYERRVTMACMQIAKDNKDPEWKKLVTWQQKKNASKAKIIRKWRSKAERIAKKSQQAFLKGGPKGTGVLPAKFRKFGGEDRISKD